MAARPGNFRGPTLSLSGGARLFLHAVAVAQQLTSDRCLDVCAAWNFGFVLTCRAIASLVVGNVPTIAGLNSSPNPEHIIDKLKQTAGSPEVRGTPDAGNATRPHSNSTCKQLFPRAFTSPRSLRSPPHSLPSIIQFCITISIVVGDLHGRMFDRSQHRPRRNLKSRRVTFSPANTNKPLLCIFPSLDLFLGFIPLH